MNLEIYTSISKLVVGNSSMHLLNCVVIFNFCQSDDGPWDQNILLS